MSHFGRSGPPDITDTYSLLVLNITFRTTADDLFPLFDKYGKFADEAQKAVDRLDGTVVDGREITVQFAKYGPKAERMHREDHYKDRDYRRSRSESYDRYERDRHRGKDRDSRRRSKSRSASPVRSKGRGRDRYDEDRRSSSRSRSVSPAGRNPSPQKSPSPHKASPPRGESPDRRSRDGHSPSPQIVSPLGCRADSRSPSS
ncbi:Serine/arginine-rich splicing factor SC35 [Hibiscus syriacus]|uniref:Serine/arginine-rich splicing factor SC35 n=1 Tax=Hibiscus syriacus TaxID=106335 RepID=A0A6A2XAY4_HIBSY|nr:Serine/arginine-rich splicing factor SC35 [Hibiscus syriacus]